MIQLYPINAMDILKTICTLNNTIELVPIPVSPLSINISPFVQLAIKTLCELNDNQ
jgi:hypothetical protein